MKMSRALGAAVLTCGLVLLAAPSFAHHSVSSEFDPGICKAFTGILTNISWQNPHAFFYMDIKDARGTVESWAFQTYSVPTLKRSGMDRQAFLDNIGKEISVRGCVARAGTKNYAAAGTLKLPDGQVRSVGQLQDDAK